jgi:hypothetical protein
MASKTGETGGNVSKVNDLYIFNHIVEGIFVMTKRSGGDVPYFPAPLFLFFPF